MSDHYLKEDLYNLATGDKSFFDFLQGGSLDGIWYWDLTDPDHEWYSPEFIRLFGYDPETIEHTPAFWQAHIFEEDLKVALDNYHRHLEDPSYPYDMVVRYRHCNGSTVWVRCRGLIVRDEEGTPIRMLGAHTDLTEMKRVEESLRHSNEELERFAYVVSHDLQQPLRTISAYTDIIKEDFSDIVGQHEEADLYLSYIGEASDRLRELVHGLLTYSRVRTEGADFEPVKVEKLIRTAGDMQGFLDELVVQPSAAVVLGDSSQLLRVFLNLLGNAHKYRSPERDLRIEVQIIPRKREVLIRIVDNGMGIAAKHLEDVFHIFKRLHRADEIEGTGMGLTLARKILERHQGRVWLESDGESGTTACVSLPRA